MEENKKTTEILSFERYHGRRKKGSSSMRCHWLLKHWPEAMEFVQGREYDAIIYQKVYWPEHARSFSGVKILDLCDPDFLSFIYQTKEMIDEVDVITTSTETLRDAVQAFTKKPVVHVPDRLDLDYHTERKDHKGQGRAKTIVWFGYSTGFHLLKACLSDIRKLKLNLIVISDSGFVLPSNFLPPRGIPVDDKFYIEVMNLPWKLETVNADIVKGDFVINPRSKLGKWKYKSNNKTLTSWALGMPVAHNISELKKYIDEEARVEESEKRLKEVEEKWDAKQSIEEYRKLIDEVKEDRGVGKAVEQKEEYVWVCPRKSCNANILKTKKPFLMDGIFKCKSCNHIFNADELLKSNIGNIKNYIRDAEGLDKLINISI